MDRLDCGGRKMLFLGDGERRLLRTVSDGALRRLLLGGLALADSIAALPEVKSFVVPENATRREALEIMQRHTVNQLPMVDPAGRVIDLIERADIDEQILLSTPHMG